MTYAMRSVRDAYNVSSLDQAAATILLSHSEYREQNLAEIDRMMNILKQRLNGIAEKSQGRMKVYPSVVNFVLLWLEDARFVNDELHKKDISLRLLDDHLLRISVGDEKTLDFVLGELEAIVLNQR